MHLTFYNSDSLPSSFNYLYDSSVVLVLRIVVEITENSGSIVVKR